MKPTTLPRVLVTTGTVRRLMPIQDSIAQGYVFQDGLLRKIRRALEKKETATSEPKILPLSGLRVGDRDSNRS